MSEVTGIQEATLSRIENDKMDGSLNTYILIATVPFKILYFSTRNRNSPRIRQTSFFTLL